MGLYTETQAEIAQEDVQNTDFFHDEEISLEPLEGTDALTIRKPDEVLQEYTNLQKENESIKEQVEAFKKQYELVFAEYEKMINKISENETRQSSLKDEITESMEKSNLATIANDRFRVAFIAATVRNTFDSTKFKKEHADLYKDYLKQSSVKAYVKITDKE